MYSSQLTNKFEVQGSGMQQKGFYSQDGWKRDTESDQNVFY